MRVTRPVFAYTKKILDFYSQFNPSPLSIKQFIDFGLNACEKKSYMFLRKELPVRLANIMKEIALLPQQLLRQSSVAMVSQWYHKSFEEIINYEKIEPSGDTLKRFVGDLKLIRDRHSDVVQTMALGILELKEAQHGEIEPSTEAAIQYFLDRLYMSRISIRMLINQHTMLFGNTHPDPGKHIGCIDPTCNPSAVVRDAYDTARFLCDQYYFGAPALEIEEHNDLEADQPVRIIYVPSHLYHMLFELFKNSMRAVMERYEQDEENIPPIKVTIVRAKEDICVKMSDRGGGIPRSQMDLLFKYMYSTAPQPQKHVDHQSNTVPLAGYGYGLPISRLYARYFHGDLCLMSCEGYGTDALIYLKTLSDEANELLPIFNSSSKRFYEPYVPVRDWSSSNSKSRPQIII
ncbi:pyruvate dehydrogenase (acetyl-transferring) kinase, mitochondrial [Phlebotomus argentipes]|uniref:pyruvate dehydrogenase (acetyl-transferring) kinase, mitochondrial n=1 Tax=Phlebotomus argentipes TaxID=94469 RepID=UPI002893751F|nr:pyruvate dehydrogenase (acetyl-transferring) kinase, mitochondrial [Phlebotomus argentipes]XP_059608382.1 pyruvate dehydrogenase (acetyl-transferring) kinase, mitochondrial [Phlebotomus argentipes]XP_059608384.1 pyruvate dehydrogenase (acetyl-transferring) kinase, mitochondrial [Phlebotomus argentipes]